MISEDDVTPEALADEYPDWEPWLGIDSLWHARIKGATPPVIVTGEDLADLRDEIRRKVSRLEEGRT